MKKIIIAIIALLAIVIYMFSACTGDNYSFAEKTYIYEKLIGDGAFTIKINSDGTYSYTEGTEEFASGKWMYQNEILTLKNDSSGDIDIINHFKVEQGNLVFITEGSSNFPSVTVENGEVFFDITK